MTYETSDNMSITDFIQFLESVKKRYPDIRVPYAKFYNLRTTETAFSPPITTLSFNLSAYIDHINQYERDADFANQRRRA